jgi:NADPH2:quinone reductase
MARGNLTQIDIRKLMNRQARLGGSLLRPRPLAFKAAVAEALEARVWPLFNDRRLRPVIDRSFAFGEANAAIDWLDQRRHIGKVILQVGE